MAVTNGYCTLAELRARLGAITGKTDQDSVMEDTIEAASRSIDKYTGRKFYAASGTYYYTPSHFDLLFVNNDIVSIGTLSTDEDGDRTYETTWSATDYDLLPFNESVKTMIEVTPQGLYNFPLDRKSVKIEGTFGIDGAPHDIREACLLLSARYFKRKDTPFGIAGVTELGVTQMLQQDTDIQALLNPWRRVI